MYMYICIHCLSPWPHARPCLIDAVASTFPGIIGVSTGLAAGICVAVIAMIAMAIFSMYKRMKANNAITHGTLYGWHHVTDILLLHVRVFNNTDLFK